MPVLAPGMYMRTSERAYEAETSVYLLFQIKSALVSIEFLLDKNIVDFSRYGNKYQYFHYYSDHLLYSWGQISVRFHASKGDSDLDKERKKANNRNYCFSKERYPILSNRIPRNFVEHIDQYNNETIKKEHGVGCFNLIDLETDMKIVIDLQEKRETHPYILDLVKQEILLFRRKKKIDISLEKMKTELKELQKNVEFVLEMATD